MNTENITTEKNREQEQQGGKAIIVESVFFSFVLIN